jgi:hypothetical protein
MLAPFEGSLTSTTQVEIKWYALTTHAGTGGSAITSYHLMWDQGMFGLAWFDLIGDLTAYTQTEYIVSS